MSAGSISMVLYENLSCGLEDAYDAVLDTGFSILRQDNKLAVWCEDGPMLFLSFACGEAIRQAAMQVGHGTPLQAFGTFTPDLHRLADWRIANEVDTVAMERTGVCAARN